MKEWPTILQVDFFSFASTLILLTLIIYVAYYSTRILTQMRKGLLERSWIDMSRGSLILAGGILATMIHDLYSNYPIVSDATGYVSPTLLIVGSVFVVTGFRSHYLALNPDHPKVKMQELIEN
ncbi:MAG: hypothetical protein M1587_10755, partial [Thaumarchaeota archaeon]|nr:hypothetical protein [Nitrososphaerota archaeon]